MEIFVVSDKKVYSVNGVVMRALKHHFFKEVLVNKVYLLDEQWLNDKVNQYDHLLNERDKLVVEWIFKLIKTGTCKSFKEVKAKFKWWVIGNNYQIKKLKNDQFSIRDFNENRDIWGSLETGECKILEHGEYIRFKPDQIDQSLSLSYDDDRVIEYLMDGINYKIDWLKRLNKKTMDWIKDIEQ